MQIDARLTLRLPREIVFKLKRAAKADQRTLSSFIRFHLDKIANGDKNKKAHKANKESVADILLGGRKVPPMKYVQNPFKELTDE